MPTVESDIRIAAPPDLLFNVSQDYYLRPRWDPFVRSLRFLDGAEAPAVGVRVWVQATTGMTMTVEYVAFQPHTSIAVKMVEGPPFFESFGGVWRFEPVDEGTCVVFRDGFRTRWRFARPVIDPIIRWWFGRDIRKRLRGLRAWAERGNAAV